jgi:glycosyltransferase family protein
MSFVGGLKRKIKNIKNYLVLKCVRRPNVLSIDDTLDYILEHKCSVSRYGDGELDLMMNISMYYQEQSDKLSNALLEVFNKQSTENHIVCLGDFFDYAELYTKPSVDYSKKLILLHKDKYKTFINKNKVYYNSNITRPYMIYKDKSKVPSQMAKWKLVWENRDVLIIEGEKTRFGIGNNLLSTAKSVKRILCPSNNAFNRYDDILKATIEYGKDKVILIALGATATVLAYDLSKCGLFAIDIGHLDIEYEWYLRNASEKCEIKGKYSTGKFTETEIVDLPEYTESVLLKINE